MSTCLTGKCKNPAVENPGKAEPVGKRSFREVLRGGGDGDYGSELGEYIKNVTPMVEKRGGRYLVRTAKVERLEGERKLPQVFLIIEWPSKEAAEAFYNSEEYRPYRERRIAGAKNEFLLVAGEDMTKTAQMAG